MTFSEKCTECSRSKTVRIFLLVLLLILIVVGVVWFLNSSSGDETKTRSLEVIPDLGHGSLIQYRVADRESVRTVTKKIESVLKPYNVTSPNLYKGCNFFNPPPLGKTCDVDLKAFDPCTTEKLFGYNSAKPCVFLKLSRSAEFVPQFYNDTRLPGSMPEDLKEEIKGYIRTNKKNSQIIWVSCEGKTELDIVNAGPIIYLPRRGFPGFYYPCTSEVSCTEPLVAIHFEKPKRNVQINMQCKIWAENLQETIDFELIIE